jgi:secretion/DNA translocation related TadE-like protein
MVTVFVALAAAALGAGIVARHRAQNAADLAALAGAADALEGEVAACGTARARAGDNGGTMVSCHLEGWDVTVSVEVLPASAAAIAGPARASARAGPVDAGPAPP